MDMVVGSNETQQKRYRWPSWLTILLLLIILAAGAALRLVGMDWDEGQHLHPDERFMTMVITSIQPVKLSQYFDAATSTMNPHNVGFGYYVYGTLPLIITRFIAESFNMTGYGNVYMVGRYLSALMDLLTVVLVFLAGSRLFKNEKIGLLGAAFAALSVLPIQLSHYFTVDTFSNFFSFLAIYLAIVIMTVERPNEVNARSGDWHHWLREDWNSLWLYAAFGVALGMAVASKINAGLIAVLLPLAAGVWWSRLPEDQKERQAWIIVRNLVIAAVISLLVFRIFQPYAFMGPGFFGLKINPKWVANLKEAANISSGNVEVPYAWQWARRPIWFALQNMVVWGLGLPLGILAWTGFIWMGWRILQGEWRKYILLWGWTGLYFAWQSLNWVRAMRYQLLIYPTLAMIAAWLVVELWNIRLRREKLRQLTRILAGVIGGAVLVLTALWAYAFIQIYTRPVTRIAASSWIYENVPGAFNLGYQTIDGLKQQPIGAHLRMQLSNGVPVELTVTADADAWLTGFQIAHVVDATNNNTAMKTLVVEVFSGESDSAPIGVGMLSSAFPPDASDPRGSAQTIKLETPVEVKAGQQYHFRISMVETDQTLFLYGTLALELYQDSATRMQFLMDATELIQPTQPFLEGFNTNYSGTLGSIVLNRVVDWSGNPGSKTLKVSILDSAQGGAVISSGTVSGTFLAGADPRGEEVIVNLDQPIEVTEKQSLFLQIEFVAGDGRIGISGNRPALESPWDDPIPLGLDGYSPFDYYAGIYRSDLNFEMYWDDTQDKLMRFENILDQADYIFISSNRQYGSITRVPERYPLTVAYYRSLLGCPDEKDLIWCYNVAQPGMFAGQLGFELVEVFQSDPNLGNIRFNSQFAEEAFTVYDAPKVLIFRKTDAYSHDSVAKILGSVDLSKIIKVTPGGASKSIGTLLLPKDQLARQQAGGTWADLFNRDGLINRSPVVTVIAWYLFISLLGWIVYPFTRLALGGLADKGYPLSRLVGMVLFAWLAWISGSAGVTVSRGFLAGVLGLLLVTGAVLAYVTRRELFQDLQDHWKHYLWLEVLGLVFFLVFLFVRLGNPDLWHPYKGGEKPMDFSYFNAVIKSSTFPPYDPWFAGGYINYYYYGFVLVGMPVKLLGIIPSIAYNLILPTLFSLLAMGAFCGGYNLVLGSGLSGTRQINHPIFRNGIKATWKEFLNGLHHKNDAIDQVEKPSVETITRPPSGNRSAWIGGIASAAGMVLLGNLGSVRMVWHGLMRLAAPGGVIDSSTFFQRIGWTFDGIIKYLGGIPLPYPPGDWYWIPSRVYPGDPITEFPLFTFLYADLHAHMMAMVLTVLAIAWTISILLRKWRWGEGESNRHARLGFLSSLILGALAIGALRPTNTWDFPTYLILGVLVLIYTGIRSAKPPEKFLPELNQTLRRVIFTTGAVVLLVGLALLTYQPFAKWYGQAYTSLDIYKGDRSPFWSYLTHWGLFLFVLASWFVHESLDWMAKTPASALKKLKPYEWLIQTLVVLFLAMVAYLTIQKITIGWLALGLAAWALVLMLRPGQPDTKRLALFMAGTALTITLVVELVTLHGDLGRMNTVFKFYLQAWILFAVSSGAALIWLLPAVIHEWKPGWKTAWSVGLVLLVGGAAWFPLLAGNDKITDRMAPMAPHTLDGMTYMAYSTYNDQNVNMDLSQDYRAIQWMQDNVKGSPVIVEGNAPEYRWGSRFTIYTGLPGVVGWNWHQRQQRAVLAVDWVWPRVNEIEAFYKTTDPAETLAFLQKYNVNYIIVGQLEKAYYPGEGLVKFSDFNGVYWREVYHEQDTVIYEVTQK